MEPVISPIDSAAVVTAKPPTPDALILKESVKRGTRFINRVNSIADIAEPILGVDRSRNERAYIRQQPQGKLFITKSIHDTLLFPKWHDRENEERYRWEVQPDGSKFGYLVDGATPGGEIRDED
jgi:hypothetical protein